MMRYKNTSLLNRCCVPILLWVLCVAWASVADAQYFSNRYTLNQRDGFLSSLQVVNDTIYAMFGMGDSITNKPISVFAKFNKSGQLLSSHYFDIPSRSNIGTNVNTLIRSNDGGYAYGGWTQGSTLSENSLLILKYDRHGNFQWYNEIIDTNYLSFYANAIVQDSFSNYYITGFLTHKLSIDEDIYIAKTDSIGNLIYMKILNDLNLDDEAFGICINNKGNIVIGGSGVIRNVTNYLTAKGYMKTFELDTGGNVINYVMNTDSNGPASANILSLSDGGYIISSEYTCGRSPDHVYGINCVEKLDSAFNVVWRTDIGVCSIYNDLLSLKKAPDGNYIVTGVSYSDTVLGTRPTNGFIAKVSETGQLIWSKEYRGLTNFTNNDMNEFASVGFLSDSSIIVGGLSLDYADAVHPEQGWLLHLDTAGCLPDSNSCGLPSGVADVPYVGAMTVRAYPNPASGQIVFEVVSAAGAGYRLYVSDMLGQPVAAREVAAQGAPLSMDVSGWQSGLYFFRVVTEDGFERSGRFVVNGTSP